jgi:hypothetical protein
MESAKTTPSDKPMASSNWEYKELTALNAQTASLLVISRDVDSYEGGAHPFHTRRYYVIDRSNGQSLSLKDLVKSDAMPALETLAGKELHRELNIPLTMPLSEKGFFADQITDIKDYFVSPKGISLQWDAADIAPYYFGPVQITIPFADCKGILSEKGLELLKDLLES